MIKESLIKLCQMINLYQSKLIILHIHKILYLYLNSMIRRKEFNNRRRSDPKDYVDEASCAGQHGGKF